MALNKIEVLLDAIGKLHGSFNPESECYAIRNPLMMRSWAKPGRHLITDSGVRIFPSILAGMKAGIFDLELKISGKSRAGLKSTDALVNLLGCYGLKEKQAIDSVVSWLRRALKDQSISSKTPLSFFVEDAVNTKSLTVNPENVQEIQ